jgi:LysM repeat protein
MAGARKLPRAAFNIWLRTGRAPVDRVEYKFNGWHDVDDGRFTHVGGGRYFPPGSSASVGSARVATAPAPLRPGFGGGGASGSWGERDGKAPSSRVQSSGLGNSPGVLAQTFHIVRRGETLLALAKRERLTVPQLAAANDIADPDQIEVGQTLRVPRRIAPDRVVIEVSKFRYELDQAGRTRLVYGELGVELTKRSRILQATAGGTDRRNLDDGGHLIAPRFGGPREAYNISRSMQA